MSENQRWGSQKRGCRIFTKYHVYRQCRCLLCYRSTCKLLPQCRKQVLQDAAPQNTTLRGTVFRNQEIHSREDRHQSGMQAQISALGCHLWFLLKAFKLSLSNSVFSVNSLSQKMEKRNSVFSVNSIRLSTNPTIIDVLAFPRFPLIPLIQKMEHCMFIPART